MTNSLDYLPSNQQMRDAYDRPSRAKATERTAEATLAIQELRGAGLTWSEVSRLCGLNGYTTTMKKLEDGTAQMIHEKTATAILEGYSRYMDGDRSYRRRHGRVAGTPKPLKPVPVPTPIRPVEVQPTFAPRPSLRERLALRIKEAA